MKEILVSMIVLAIPSIATAEAEPRVWTTFSNSKQLVARLLPDLRVKYNAQDQLLSVTKANGEAVDVTTFGHLVGGELGYWTSPAMQLVGKARTAIKNSSDAEEVIAALHTITHGASFVAKKLYRARPAGRGWFIETDHDFKRFPGNILYIHPYEIECDDNGNIVALRQRKKAGFGSPSVYRNTWHETLQKQKSHPGAVKHFDDVLTYRLKVAFAKEQKKKLVHNSRRYYPDAVTEVKDTATGHKYFVAISDSKIFAENREGIVEHIFNVFPHVDFDEIAGTPVIRHLALKDDQLIVTVGKHTQFAVNRNTGNVTSLGSD